MTRVPSDADIVFFPTQKPGDAQTLARQLVEQGKKAKVFGGDGSNDPSQFKTPGAYVSNFAPDITGIAADKAIIAAWKKDNPGKAVGSFGPPTYGAVQVLLNAVKLACAQGHGSLPNRRAVVAQRKARADRAELDPGRIVPLVDEVERPAEREVLHLPDPGQRLVQARRLAGNRSTLRAARLVPGRSASERIALDSWTSSSPSPSTALTLGSVYALIALGYTLVYGVLKLLNFAHGDVFMVGSYIGFGMLNALGGATNPIVPLWLALILVTPRAMAGCALLGVVIERFAYRPLRDAPRIAPLISALGVSFFLAYSMQLLFGAAVPRLQPVRRAGQPAVPQGVPHRRRQCLARPHHHHRLGIRADGRALVPRQQDADREGDARDLVRPRGRGDDGHRHRPGDRVHVRARLGARGRGRRAVRDPRADPGVARIPRTA